MKKIFLLLLTIFFTGSIWAQDAFSLTLDHSALSVKDVNRAAEFYINVLKFKEITNRTKKEGIRWIALGDGKELHLISTIEGDIVITKAVHIAFKAVNFDAFINELNKKNIPYAAWDGTQNKITVRADGIKQVYIQDPDHYWIEVNSVD